MGLGVWGHVVYPQLKVQYELVLRIVGYLAQVSRALQVKVMYAGSNPDNDI